MTQGHQTTQADYYENLQSARALLIDNELLDAVIARAKKTKKLDIYITGAEQYNWPDPKTGYETQVGPRENGFYDVEGHTWTDIDGYFSINPFKWNDLKRYVKNIGSWVKDFFELFTFKSPGPALQFAWSTMPFRFTWQSWVWTVEAMETIKDDLIWDKMEAIHGEKMSRMIRQDYKKFREEEIKIDATITRQDLIEYANQNYYRITPYMWVSKSDPTVILIDQVLRPYDLRNGWSNLMISTIVWEWLQIVGEYSGFVKTDTGQIKSVNLINKSIARGVAEIALGRTISNEEAKAELDKMIDKYGEKKEDGSGEAQGD